MFQILSQYAVQMTDGGGIVDLSVYCSEAGIANLFYIAKTVFTIIQIIVPIILIISAAVSLFGMVMDPEDRDFQEKRRSTSRKRGILNKFVAAIVVFFIPLIVNLVLGLLSNGGSKVSKYNFASCWDKAGEIHQTAISEGGTTTEDPCANTKMRVKCIPNSIETDSNGNYKYDTENCIKCGDYWYQCKGCGSASPQTSSGTAYPNTTTHQSQSGQTHSGTGGHFGTDENSTASTGNNNTQSSQSQSNAAGQNSTGTRRDRKHLK